MTSTPIPYSSGESASGASGFFTQTLAIFHDAYRELNARKMFWVALGLSLLAIAAFALIGVTPTGLKFFSYEQSTELIPPRTLYKSLFNDLMIGTWLTWAAIILAVISTASIFPDFLTGGSIDLFLAKPISRARLFITKYIAGMAFVFLQVAIFAVVAFFVVGIRGHMWEPRLFWMIPIVLCFFSYLFSVSVFFGVMMRSTLAALLFTILFWLLVYAVHSSEVWLQATINITQQDIADINDQLAAKSNPAPTASPATHSSGSIVSELETAAKFAGLPRVLPPEQQKLLDERNLDESNLRSIQFWHHLIFPVQVIVPKTTETISLLNDMLLSRDEFENMMDVRRENAMNNGRTRHAHHLDLADEMDQITRARSMWWVIASSLCFEGVVILFAGWLFCRRDY
jgi:ABC-type transport system involved in multi-copper enzyme maturation permease subunit